MISLVGLNRMRQLVTAVAVTACAVTAWTAAVVFPSAVAASGLGAQTSTGTIRGVLTTAQNEPAVGATISARNVASGLTRSVLTNERGSFVLLGLVAGDYEIIARRVGSEAITRRQTVGIGQTLTLDLTLQATATTL